MMTTCKNCGIIFTARKSSYGIYCCNKCQQEYQTKLIVENWLNGIKSMYGAGRQIRKPVRDWMIRKSDNKCSKCGWNELNEVTGKSPLEIDHIEGNWQNESSENLRVLCPNCHSLTATHKALNKGKGRNYRRIPETKISP
jgi:ribosomal protein L37AE/L43A